MAGCDKRPKPKGGWEAWVKYHSTQMWSSTFNKSGKSLLETVMQANSVAKQMNERREALAGVEGAFGDDEADKGDEKLEVTDKGDEELEANDLVDKGDEGPAETQVETAPADFDAAAASEAAVAPRGLRQRVSLLNSSTTR
eukprot:2231620-Pyramimonas_sp.AAC.1